VAFEIVGVGPAGTAVTRLGLSSAVEAHALLEGRLLVAVLPSRLTGSVTPVQFEIRVAGQAPRIVTSSFIGPASGARGVAP
jgi:hypothetical protein